LVGEEYAAWRALAKDADPADIRYVIKATGEATGNDQEYWISLLEVVISENSGTVDRIAREDKAMGSALMEIESLF